MDREILDAIAQVVGYSCIGAFTAAIVWRAMIWVFDGR